MRTTLFLYAGTNSRSAAYHPSQELDSMKILVRSVSLAAISLLAVAALAQNGDHWDKTYSITGQATLVLATGDSNLNIPS